MTNNGGYKLEYLEKYQKRPSQPSGNKNKRGKNKRGCLARGFILLVQFGLLGLFLGILAFVGAYIYLSNELSDSINQVVAYRGTGVGGTPRFFDRNGNLLFELTTTEKRLWLAYSEIPQDVINATVAVEDDTFWTNYGVDPAAIGAALLNNYRNQDGRPVGASTITQQLVRHIAFTYEERVSVSYERKLREIFLAFIMTQQRSKEAIIQMYLNEIYYGNLAYGIEAAAQTYFGKPAQSLNLAESAFLAGLPQSPLDWDPYTNFEAAKARQEFILDLMVGDGVVTELDAAIAKRLTLHIQPRITANEAAQDVTLEAAHFVLYVQNELERLYGPDAIALGGWQITTSLDLNIHHMAETAAREQITIREANHNVSNASVVILKPGTGEILAMVGSLDYFDEAIDGQVNVALSPRQPGSSIKPITYVTALQRGWSTADVLWDVPIELDLGDGEKMVPVNYDGYYRGPVLLRDALANSYNIPPVQLLRDVGVPNFVATARSMGIESLREPPGFYGLALTLGGGEVPLLEMTHAYATLANQGQKPRLTAVLKITDSRGNVIFDAQQNQLPAVNAIDAKIAYIITNILAVDQHVGVVDELAGRRDRRGQATAEDHVVQTALEELEQLLARLGLAAARVDDEAAELALAQAVVEAKLLLLLQLPAVVGLLATPITTVRAGGVGAALDGLARQPGQVQTQRPHQLHARATVSGHRGLLTRSGLKRTRTLLIGPVASNKKRTGFVDQRMTRAAGGAARPGRTPARPRSARR